MRPFLYQVASLFYERYGAEVSRLAFVFPNRRTGLFFQKYLSEIADAPIFSPSILTINDLFLRISGKRQADRVSMLFSLYDIYIGISGSSESFDEFLYWGEMLLNDFDDIDKYMVDARMLFSNLTDLREIEDGFDFLDEEQIAAIRSFWSSFYPKSDSPNQREFLAVWQVLYQLYNEFRIKLSSDGLGYDGMIFREVVEMMESGDEVDLPYDHIVFVGLNALSISEERFLKQLKKRGVADFYWDYLSERVTDPDNRASYFVGRNMLNFPSSVQLPSEKRGNPTIDVIGVPSGVGQAKFVNRLLNEWCESGAMSTDNALRTAVILPDENLLIPVLNAIPDSFRRVNVTMGYPLASTPVASFIEYILALQENIRLVDMKPMFYFRDVLPVLNHRYISSTSPDVVAGILKDITKENKINISREDLCKTHLLDLIFTPVSGIDGFSTYLISILEELNRILGVDSEDDVDDKPVRSNELEQEFIFHYYTTINRLRDVIISSGVEMRVDTFFRLLKRVADGITIPFHGEPLSGLQIMGVLETRSLDFDRIIILSMNEGVFPKSRPTNSFIPYNLRKGFGLPTYEHQDSIWAYHFYRLLERASNVVLMYDTRGNGGRTGEVSRFVHQLRYHYEVDINDKLLVYNVSSSKISQLSIPKRPDVMRALMAFREGGEKSLSASAINTYLDCPLKFYFSVVQGIREEDEVSETIESDVFGSILHKVMEELYARFEGKMVTADLLKAIKSDETTLKDKIARAFASEFFKSEKPRPLTGQNLLIGEMIAKYVRKILDRDSKLTPFIYIESERKVKGLFKLSDGSSIQLKGFIDRIDEVKGVVRIIDYKSGLGTTKFKSVESLFDKEDNDRAKAIMQVFLYCWMYNEQPGNEGKIIRPGIYYVRSLFTDPFDPNIYHNYERGKSEEVNEFATFKDDYLNVLRGCLDEIFDDETPFTQTTTGKACAYCPFKSICGR